MSLRPCPIALSTRAAPSGRPRPRNELSSAPASLVTARLKRRTRETGSNMISDFSQISCSVNRSETQRTFRVAIAGQRLRDIRPVLQGVAGFISSRRLVAISGLGHTLDDVDRATNGRRILR